MWMACSVTCLMRLLLHIEAEMQLELLHVCATKQYYWTAPYNAINCMGGGRPAAIARRKPNWRASIECLSPQWQRQPCSPSPPVRLQAPSPHRLPRRKSLLSRPLCGCARSWGVGWSVGCGVWRIMRAHPNLA